MAALQTFDQALRHSAGADGDAWADDGIVFVGRLAAALSDDELALLGHIWSDHALNGRPGGKAVPIQVVQNNLGHASIGTTSGYLTTERDARLAAMKGFGEKAS